MAKAKLREVLERGEEERSEAAAPVRPPASDKNDPELVAHIQAQARALAESPDEKEIMDWIEAVTADMDWDR